MSCNNDHSLKKKNILSGFHKCIYCNKIEMFKTLYKCTDCDEYCHRKCYNGNMNQIENGNNKIGCKFVQSIESCVKKRCTINPILEELYKLFPEVMHPPYNGFFFGNLNTTIIIQ